MDSIHKQLEAKLKSWHEEEANWPGEDICPNCETDECEHLRNEQTVSETAYHALVEAISRHPTAEDDPDVIDALLAIQEALTRISESRT